MRLLRTLLLLLCTLSPPLLSQMKIFDTPLSPRIANYTIHAELHPESETVTGREAITWRNTTTRAVSTLQFHLYLNAFANNQSTFMKESRGRNRGFSSGTKQEEWGYINVSRMNLWTGANLLPSLAYIHPDDENADDRTVAEVKLPKPCGPAETIRVDVEFTSKLPRVFARSGFAEGGFFMVAQWFPKIGVLQPDGWNCHEYHSNSEFFADFGVYDVQISVPRDYVVAANGTLVGKRRANSTMTYQYHQEDVHDFVWAADPRFITRHGVFHNDSTGGDVDITIFTYRTNETYAPVHLDAARHALAYFQEWFGVYPYRTLTIVDPPANARGAGGMEYPAFFTTMTIWWLPKGIHVSAMVTIHEFGHNYFQGMLASNEFEEAWLDEGINSYAELKSMERYYGTPGSYIDFLGLKMDGVTFHRSSYITSPNLDRVVEKSWLYAPGQYSRMSYSKPALLLRTLEGIVGQETMARIMKTYFQEWKFKHPRTENFIAVANRVAKQDLSWYFAQVLYGTGSLDYAVESVRTEPLTGKAGFVGSDSTLRFVDEKRKGQFESVIEVVRKGTVIVPVDVLFVFDDGNRIRETWDGKREWREFRFRSASRLSYADVDPDRKLVLDTDMRNNSRRMHEERRGVWRVALELLYRVQSLLQHLTFFS